MNLIFEQALISWLKSIDGFEGVAIHAGQSDEEIPGDQPVIIATADNDELVGEGLHRITARLLVSTPGHIETDTHSQLVSALRGTIDQVEDLSGHMPEDLAIAGAVLNAFGEAQMNSRRMASAELIFGLTQI